MLVAPARWWRLLVNAERKASVLFQCLLLSVCIMLYFQLVIMAGTVMLAYYFEYTDTFSVHVQGFFCYDNTYTKPYLGPEDSSAVPPVLLYALVTGLPTLLVSKTHSLIHVRRSGERTPANGQIYKRIKNIVSDPAVLSIHCCQLLLQYGTKIICTKYISITLVIAAMICY